MKEDQKKYIKKILCPTCYKIRESEIRKELFENLKLGEALINQCEECRKKGLEVNLEDTDKLKEVLTGGNMEIGKLISEESIREGVEWLRDEFPGLFEAIRKLGESEW